MEAKRRPAIEPESLRLRGWIDLAVGLVLFTVGALLLPVAHDAIASPLSFAIYAPLVLGGLFAARGLWRILRSPRIGALPFGFMMRGGYKSFVAWRYLMVSDPKVTPLTKALLGLGLTLVYGFGAILKLAGGEELYDPLRLGREFAALFTMAVMLWGVLRYSKPAIVTWLIGAGMFLFAFVGLALLETNKLPLPSTDSGFRAGMLMAFTVTRALGALLVGLAMFFGFLRSSFTFFTVVPIGGVWIGTAALVMVLAVMSGFEADLRDKILGSNAHVQLAREDGDFLEWRDAKAQIDRMPEVVASTPFAVSEVVVAANNTGMNVIIKGIDPDTVGNVTDLVSDLEDREAMKRLEPIIDDSHDLQVPQQPRPSGDVVDPPPDDMPMPGEPIDFSGTRLDDDGADGSAGAGHRHPGPGTVGDDSAGPLLEGPVGFGGDANDLIDVPEEPFPPAISPRARDIDATADHARVGPPPPVLDPPPADLLTTDEPPADYSSPDYLPESVVRVIDIPFDSPTLSRRTQSLPGILVGRELVKQTHLYTGEEVRIVSPLSDPANPDATGTPIPFHRDFRVAGTFYTGMYEYDLKYVYVTLEALQDFLDRGDAVDGIEIRVRNPDDIDAFVAKLQSTFGAGYRVQGWKELNRSLFSALKLEKIAMFLVLGIVIMVASFAIIGNLIMVVQGKTRQISLLKTLGASDVGVLQLFATQGLMIGAIGTVLGVATGLLGCWAANKFGIPVSREVYYIDRLPIHVEPMSVLAAASAGILISIAATLYPAVVAARIRPAAGLRH